MNRADGSGGGGEFPPRKSGDLISGAGGRNLLEPEQSIGTIRNRKRGEASWGDFAVERTENFVSGAFPAKGLDLACEPLRHKIPGTDFEDITHSIAPPGRTKRSAEKSFRSGGT